MALPSQMPRTTRQVSFRPPDRSRRGRSGTLIVSALIVGSAVGLWWWAWGSKDPGEQFTASRPAPAVINTNDPVSVPLGEPRGSAQPDLERRLAQPARTIHGTDSPRSPLVSTIEPLRTGPAGPEDTATPGRAAPEPPVSTGQATPEPTPGGNAPHRDPIIQRFIAAADAAMAAGRPIDARIALNRALHDPRAGEADEEMLRARLADLNQTLLFSPAVTPGDPLTDTVTIQPGDRLVRLVGAHDMKVDWRLIQRINRMSDPGRLRIGQKLKTVRGPFHAVVHKSAYRLDLYADATDPDGNRLFIRSFPVGLGEHGSTPIGKWAVRRSSKLINPHWVNPRTGERFHADDPKNPIGEHWIGLTGVDRNTEVLSGYGIHGTIEPESIGRDASMGCVRMLAEDVALIYELLVEGDSTVEILP